jgi:hypothetical protein
VLQASQLYERAISGVLSTCALLYFAYADFEEQNMKYEKVHTIYQKYLDHQARDCALRDKENKTQQRKTKNLCTLKVTVGSCQSKGICGNLCLCEPPPPPFSGYFLGADRHFSQH